MKNNWQVEINQEGNLFISGKEDMGNYSNLFGAREVESGICIYSHYLRPVRLLLKELFPSATIKSMDAIESLIKEEFCDARSVSIFKRFLENASIPYRSYNNVA
ncbi:MAG: hypothetical protein HKO66_16470 [Saprospiraceae bacterium]|nr:hypothetical protein [Bacteroidia bacterium]NNE15096.1 hypothetical protein [Saprospiraceae bacterium]NNL93840.1 hypothetical protein [Saprospiraceae bacterium]